MLKENHSNLSHDNWYPCRDLKWELAKYKKKVYSLEAVYCYVI
jgi:hypothetical protein